MNPEIMHRVLIFINILLLIIHEEITIEITTVVELVFLIQKYWQTSTLIFSAKLTGTCILKIIVEHDFIHLNMLSPIQYVCPWCTV